MSQKLHFNYTLRVGNVYLNLDKFYVCFIVADGKYGGFDGSRFLLLPDF